MITLISSKKLRNDSYCKPLYKAGQGKKKLCSKVMFIFNKTYFIDSFYQKNNLLFISKKALCFANSPARQDETGVEKTLNIAF